MAIHFLNDRELFEDGAKWEAMPPKLPAPDPEKEKELSLFEEFMTARAERHVDEDSFAVKYRKCFLQEKILPSPMRGEGASKLAASMDAERLLLRQGERGYSKLERVVDEAADQAWIGEFPYPIHEKSYTGEKANDEIHIRFDYFEEMNKHFGDMTGEGRVGDFLSRTQQESKILASKCSVGLLSGWFLIVGAAAALAGAGTVDFLPLFVQDLVNRFLWVRLTLLAAMVLTGWLTMSIPSANEKGWWFLKLWGNGLFVLGAALGGTVIAIADLMHLKQPVESINYFVIGAYLLVLALAVLVQEVIDWVRLKREKPRARKRLLELVENNAEHTHRYIRLHVLWWRSLYGERRLPKGVVNLQNSLKKVMKEYKKIQAH